MKSLAISPATRTALVSASAVAAGFLLYLGAAAVENGLGLEGAAAVGAEEGLKAAVLISGAIFASRTRVRSGSGIAAGTGVGGGLLWGLAAIAVFAAIENLAYCLAFPGGDVFLRLLWAEPVHIVSGLAEAAAIGIAAGGGRARGRPAARGLAAALLLAAAFAWHLAFNFAAEGDAGIAAKAGQVAIAVAANAAALIAFGRLFARRILIGGFLYGQR